MQLESLQRHHHTIMAVAITTPEDPVNPAYDDVIRMIDSGGKSLTLVVVGKPGCGKSTLVGDVLGPGVKEKPKVGEGKEPVTMGTELYKIKVGDVTVNVCDTRGLFDTAEGGHEEKTINDVKEICTNDRNGVLLVCIEMHSRSDSVTAETLAYLHKKCGPQIWDFAVIVLTKANEYPEANWLQKKGKWESRGSVIKREFEKCLIDNKQHVQRLFTDTFGIKKSCQIGMSKEKFDRLNIPIIPVSRHQQEDAKQMERVGYGSWFDHLLVECTTREKGFGLLKIHKKRLSHLPSDIEAPIKRYVEPRHLEHARKLAKDHPYVGGRLYLVIFRKLYWKYCRKHIVCAPRFEKADPAKEQEQQE